MEINVQTQSVVAQHRSALSNIGSTLGTKFFQAETRDCIPDFAEKVATIKSGGNIELCLNRSPRRYSMRDRDIVNLGLYSEIGGGLSLQINRDDGGIAEISIPVSENMKDFSTTSKEAVEAALNGDKTKVFSDPKKLASLLNAGNVTEKNRLEVLRTQIDKMIQGIVTTIKQNEKKVDEYYMQYKDASIFTGDGSDKGGVVVNITTES